MCGGGGFEYQGLHTDTWFGGFVGLMDDPSIVLWALYLQYISPMHLTLGHVEICMVN